jgi:hypothetical protein
VYNVFEGVYMSVKGFFIALFCVGLGGVGTYYSFVNIITATNTPTGWIILLIISFLAMFFGMGVFANRIKL